MYEIACKKSKFTAGQAAEAAGVEYHHVNHWAKTGLVRPSVCEASGSDSLRIYGFWDVVALRAVGCLRSAGFGCDSLTALTAHLQKKRSVQIDDVCLVGDADGGVREVAQDDLLSGLRAERPRFTWFLDLTALVRDVDAAAGKRVKATRGRASLVA